MKDINVLQCLYIILKSLYGGNELPENYKNMINDLIKNEKVMKIKFKFMDTMKENKHLKIIIISNKNGK